MFIYLRHQIPENLETDGPKGVGVFLTRQDLFLHLKGHCKIRFLTHFLVFFFQICLDLLSHLIKSVVVAH